MYTFNSRVRYSETDESGRLSVTGIINYLQDCSTFQSEDLGLGIDYLKEHNRAWWLTSWQIIIERYPCLGEEIVMGTWPYDFKGMFGLRNFTIQDKTGAYLVKANSVWFLFDTKKQCPVKVQKEDIRGYKEQMDAPLDMVYAPRKIVFPAQWEGLGSIAVGRHHIDTNHHVNNAQYIEIAREVLPEGFAIGELRIEYKKAAVMGDLIYPRMSRFEGGYVISLCDGQGMPYAIIWMKEWMHKSPVQE